ncbi:MAG: Ni/Fe hydrogenase subunit alpha [Anaerolineaceae bacterium]|nr:MAG: Ni/Fe hydrogenase subunit alpha [Anaerolineaceae bacterium]
MAIQTTKDVKINVHHLTRVEGHGNIVVNVREGILEQCDLQIIEAPRFFEALLRHRPYEHASHIASRICGICAVSHATASLRACENALGVELSEQSVLLRKLNLYAEMLDSHILHMYMLVAPDLLGKGSVIPLAKTDPDVVLRALRMKKVAGDLCATISGRHTHPIAMVVGGFSHYPSEDELFRLGERLVIMREDLDDTVELFKGLSVPSFERETEYIALQKEGEYCIIEGMITSSDGGSWPIEAYQSVTNEYIVPHSTAKHARHQRESYMVGALARLKINYDELHPRAKTTAEILKISPKCINPYLITIAQLVETTHFTEKAIEVIGGLLEKGIVWEEPRPISKDRGEGVGACEAPRGTLYHHYVIGDGMIKEANCIIPTAQNLANIEADMRCLVPNIVDRTPDDITLALEMLIRAYDPCISCSTHMLEVRFV